MSHIRKLTTRAALTAALLVSTAFAAEAAGTLHRGNAAEPESLDVHRSSGVSESNIQRDIYEGLTAEAADGTIIPGVAESWDVSDDGLVYTFHLRDDAMWSDGTPVTAHDFVAGFRRGLDPETAADYAFMLWPIKNGKAINEGSITDITQLGAVAIDDRTLEVTLESPTPYFIGLLAHHMAYPVHMPSIEAHPDSFTQPENFVGNGAFVLTEWVPQGHIKLEKNPDFHDAENVSLDAIYYYPTEDQENELQRFRAGELDITYDVPASQIPWIEENLAEEFHNTVYLGNYFYGINTQIEPFKDNIPLRQAMFLAIDREILTKQITKGGEIPAYGWVPPGIANYEPQQLDEWEAMTQEERNALAVEKYEEAGFSVDEPLDIEILYNTNDNHRNIAIAIAAMWKQTLGINATLRNEEWGTYLNSRDELQFDVVRAGWIGDYNDPNTFAGYLRGDIGQMNPAGWQNAEYDRLVAEAATEQDMEARSDLLEEAERIMLSEMPIIPIYYYTQQHLVSSAVSGWEDNIMDRHASRYLSVSR
ncbi:peptide ABC transporter substrate-binding protein [Inquilinus sp. CAU 1745]|uniref:peptide ABC transporter substrate-binding protein n=1 Tax=Inquilinus sp. CAU 1745 TaxID=3140369 RepID=UPI00325A7E0C